MLLWFGNWASTGNAIWVMTTSLAIKELVCVALDDMILQKASTKKEKVPYYSVNAQNVQDIQASVKFASEKDLYLVVKNTGHDQCVGC